MPYLHTNDVRLYYEDHRAAASSGEEIAAVLIHGWLCDCADWFAQRDWLASRGRVVCLDLRGHGRSSVPDCGYSPRDMAADLLALFDYLRLARAVLIAHSSGAEVAATAAVNWPGRVRALIMIDPAYGIAAADRDQCERLSADLAGPDAATVASRYVARLDTGQTPAGLARLHRTRPLGYPAVVIRRSYDDFTFGPDAIRIRPRTEAFLSGRVAPMLAIYRNATRAAVGRAFIGRPGDRVLTYPGAGHWLHQEQPARFAADVDNWLKEER
jgi:pimeloyl-ACP methyl ester carboxylesterase